MFTLNLSNALTISKYAQNNKSIKCYIRQWSYKGNHIAIYSYDNKIWAIVKDVFGKIIMLSNENIKGGINGNISQYNLLRMIEYDRDKIAITLSYNLNNNITLWIIPKLKAAGITYENIIKKAKECKKQARNNAYKYKNNHSEDNFNKACRKYQETLEHYEQSCEIKKKNNENVSDIEGKINILKIEFCLFQLEKPMRSCLPSSDDRKKVKKIFNAFKDQQFKEHKNIFNYLIESANSNKNDDERSLADNFTCAYAYEFLEDYISSAKSYLILSKKQHDVGNLQSSAFCMKKAENLVSNLERTSSEESFANNFLGAISEEWLGKTISDISDDNYFKVLLEENRLKTIAYGFKEKAQKEAEEYNANQDEKKFIDVCEAYREAINNLNSTYIYMKDNNRNFHQVENAIHELQKKYFEFKLNPLMNLYLPETSDQNSLQTNIFSLGNKKHFFVNKNDSIDSLLKSVEQISEENRSLANHFANAYVYEFLGDPISASQHYFLLCRKYLQNKNPELSVKCLEKADNLIRKESKKQSDNIPVANFLEKLDINFLNNLYNQISNGSSCESCKSYLNKIIIEKQNIRKIFENFLHKIKKHSNKEVPSCFICFNEEEADVQKWLSNILVYDLKLAGIKTIFAPKDLKAGNDINNFKAQIRKSDFVIIACTPLLKEKQQNAPDGSTLEIKLAIKRLEDTEKCGTTYLIYLKGDKGSSCPSAYFELLVENKLNISGKNTDFNYYFYAINICAGMREINTKRLEKIKTDFKSNVNDILTKTVNNINTSTTTTDTKKGQEAKLEDLLFDKLKKFYCSQEKIETLIEERTISIEDIYVRLAIIKEEKKNKEKQDEKIQAPEDGRWPTYETLYNPKESIKLEELFQHEKLKQKTEKRVIVWGAAGVGKSTCLHYIAHEWANKRLWNEFKAIFWICLRNLNSDYYPPLRRGEEDYDVYYLIARECKLRSKKYNLDVQTLRSLLVNKEFINHTLLVLDGYDELTYIADRGYLARAFKQFKDIFPNILISSRTQSVTFIQNSIEIEILGFDRKGVDQYIEKFYTQVSKTSEQPEKSEMRLKNLHDLLKQKPLIRSLSCIPINLELLCCLYFFDEQVDANTLTTITSLYSNIINWLCKRFLLRLRNNEVSSADICELENIYDHSKIFPLISILTEVAWYAMGRNTLYFPQSKIKTDFFNSIRALGLLQIKNRMANFIHSTFQEYFAAVYLANYYIKGKSKKVKNDVAKNKLIPRFALVFEMTAGYLSSLNETEALQKFFDDLLSEPYDLAVNYELNLLARCFEECKDLSIINQYAKFIEFTAGYIQNNWFINNHYIAQLLRYNLNLLSQEKIYSVILEILARCEEILINQDSKLLSDLTVDVIVKTYSFKNLEEGIRYVREKFTSFLLEMAQVSYEICRDVIKIFTNTIENTNSSDRAVNALRQIFRSEKTFEYTLMFIEKALTKTLSDEREHVQPNATKALGNIYKSGRISEEALMFIAKALTETLSYANKYARKYAAEALGEICLSEKVSEEILIFIVKAFTNSLLNNANGHLRKVAAEALEKICQPEMISEGTLMFIVKALTKALRDAEKYVRIKAAMSLNRIFCSEKISEETLMFIAKALTEALGDEENIVRLGAALMLGRICKSGRISEEASMDIVRALTKALSDEGEYGQDYHVMALGSICLSDNVSEEILMFIEKVLTKALSGPNEYVRKDVFEALGNIYKSERISEEALMDIVKDRIKSLGDAYGGIRRCAANTLVKIYLFQKPEKVSEETLMFIAKALIEALRDASEDVRKDAAEALGNICLSDKTSEETLMAIVKSLPEALRDADVYVRMHAAKTLGKSCLSESVSEKTLMDIVKALTEALSDADVYVRMEVVKALGNICLSEKTSEETLMAIVKSLPEALRDADVYVRMHAAKTLGKSCLSESVSEKTLMDIVKALTEALSDADVYVRMHSAKTLGKSCLSENVSEKTLMDIVKALTEALSDADKYARMNAAKALCNIKRFDEFFAEIVLKDINIGNWLENKKDIYYLLKNVNILKSMETCRYAVKLCNWTDYVFSYSNQKIYVADIEKGKLNSNELKETDVFGMAVWRL